MYFHLRLQNELYECLFIEEMVNKQKLYSIMVRCWSEVFLLHLFFTWYKMRKQVFLCKLPQDSLWKMRSKGQTFRCKGTTEWKGKVALSVWNGNVSYSLGSSWHSAPGLLQQKKVEVAQLRQTLDQTFSFFQEDWVNQMLILLSLQNTLDYYSFIQLAYG